MGPCEMNQSPTANCHSTWTMSLIENHSNGWKHICSKILFHIRWHITFLHLVVSCHCTASSNERVFQFHWKPRFAHQKHYPLNFPMALNFDDSVESYDSFRPVTFTPIPFYRQLGSKQVARLVRGYFLIRVRCQYLHSNSICMVSTTVHTIIVNLDATMTINLCNKLSGEGNRLVSSKSWICTSHSINCTRI